MLFLNAIEQQKAAQMAADIQSGTLAFAGDAKARDKAIKKLLG